MGKRHRLCRRRRLVEQRSIGDSEPGQVRDDRLKIEQRLKSPLADLRLIGVLAVYHAGFSRMLRWIAGGMIVP